ncbi:lytic polysaccharide monooxygenase [Pleomassaria siparia CBS 279.74]|uniref:AA9 family lytic polysaccharide monooxygenase n=1 Tax=Pleomassaria siparia CBS 279.74 TaxID=1314801 RepID=A0A6G1K7G4_9PLEO|nr:lytic polysaccharide monooxygenase [Pleomassaria siparia CBS 279.74]
MKTSTLLFTLAAAPAALAHTCFTNFYINGVTQGDGVAMRMKKDGATACSPLEDLSSNDMACNVDGSTGVSRVQSVTDGDTLTFEIRSWPNDITKERLARGHYGPCAVYLKKVDSAIKDQAYGDGWFKIWDDGYTPSDKRWCTDRVIDNGGLLNVVLPKGLEGGSYLARPEILALHNAYEGDPQFYTGCAQIFLKSTGTFGPAETVSIPGYVKTGETAVSVNIYYGDDLSKYVTPGPRVAKLVSDSAASANAQTKQAEGLRPAGCIDENANWCGAEVPDYSDEAGCWASNQNCWDQNEVCYKTSPPTGDAGCVIWQTKCQDIQDQCQAKNFNGPPNKGKDLTPVKKSIDVGLVMATQDGNVVVESPKTSAVVSVKSDTRAAPQSTSAATSSSAAAAHAPESTSAVVETAQPAPTEPDSYKVVAPMPAVTKVTISIPASEHAHAATPIPCPSGYKCIYVVHTVTETKYEYVTKEAAQKRRSVHQRRHDHNA